MWLCTSPAERSRELRRYDAGAFEYFAPSSSLLAVELFLFAWVEGRRYQASIVWGLRGRHVLTMPVYVALLARRLHSASMRFTGGDPFSSCLIQDMKEPGSTHVDPIFTNNKLPDGNEPGCAACRLTMYPVRHLKSAMTVRQSSHNGLTDGCGRRYPGGIFDPFGFSKSNLAEYKLKELKNGRSAAYCAASATMYRSLNLLHSGCQLLMRFLSCLRRLAMLAYAGFIVQHITTGTTPLKNLGAHLADPWKVNVFSNELSRAGL